jgi:hypothetical protein
MTLFLMCTVRGTMVHVKKNVGMKVTRYGHPSVKSVSRINVYGTKNRVLLMRSDKVVTWF